MAEQKRRPGRPKGSKNKSTIEKEKAQSKAKAKAQEIQAKKRADKRVVDEIWAIITIAIGAFFVVATLTNGAGKLGVKVASTVVAVTSPTAISTCGSATGASQSCSSMP